MKRFGWPVGWLILVRSVQLLFGTAVLGIACFIAAIYGTPIPSPFGYLIGIAAVTACWTVASLVLYCKSGLAPLVVIILDTAVLLAWIVAVFLDLKKEAYTLSENCKNYTYEGSDYAYPDYSPGAPAFGPIWCKLWNAKTGIMIVEMVSFTTTIALAAVVLRNHRKGGFTTGTEYTAALTLRKKPSVDESQDDTALPEYSQYTPEASPEASPVITPSSHPQSQELQQIPELAYDPLGGMRHSDPSWQQQYHMDIDDQPLPNYSRTRRARRSLSAFLDASGTEEVRLPPPAWS